MQLTRGRPLSNPRLADDIQDLTDKLATSESAYRMEISTDTRKVMVNTTGPGKVEISMIGVQQEEVQSFKNQGLTIGTDGNCAVNICLRITAKYGRAEVSL